MQMIGNFLQIQIQKQTTLPIVVLLTLSLGIVTKTWALDVTNKSVGSELIGADITGHAPYMASVSAELMTEAYNELDERVYYPWDFKMIYRPEAQPLVA